MASKRLIQDERIRPVVWLAAAFMVSILTFWAPMVMAPMLADVPDNRVGMLLAGGFKYAALAGLLACWPCLELYKVVIRNQSLQNYALLSGLLVLLALTIYPAIHVMLVVITQ